MADSTPFEDLVASRMEKLKKFYRKMNEARQLSGVEVVEEDRRLKGPKSAKGRKRRAEYVLEGEERVSKCFMEGEDPVREKLRHVGVDDAAREARKSNKNPDPVFSSYENASFRKYESLVKSKIKPDMETYNEDVKRRGEDAVKRMASDVENQIKKPDKYSIMYYTLMTGMKKKDDQAEKRRQLLAAKEANGDWRILAQTLGIPKTTAYRWISEGDRIDERGGKRYSKINEIHKNFIVEEIERNPRITLQGLVDNIFEKFQLRISKQAVSNHIDSMVYSLKNIRYEPEISNSEVNKQKRKDVVESFLSYQSQNLPILFMDETNFNLHISRSTGRSPRSKRCSTIAAASKGANVHVIGCIGSMGLVHHEVKRGSFKKNTAMEWVRECLRKAKDVYGGPVVLVVNNAPTDSSIEDVLNEEEFSIHKILRFGPYSPMLNPIEHIWSILKAFVKRVLARKIESICNAEKNDLSISEQRSRALEQLIEEGLNEITSTICNNCIDSIQNRFVDVINFVDMEL